MARAPPKPRLPIIVAALDVTGTILPVPWAKSGKNSWLRRRIRALFAWIDRQPALRDAFERFEYVTKRSVFGCEACGSCVLGHMEYVCPQTCPKQMRNGPCGGTLLGQCEVVDKPCMWVSVMQRAEASNNVAGLEAYIPPPWRPNRQSVLAALPDARRDSLDCEIIHPSKASTFWRIIRIPYSRGL